MASLCKRQQCTIERRGFRQELDSWRHKLIHCVGFESILEGLFGPELVEDLKLFQDCEPVAVSDWSFDENCLFCCLRRDKVKEHFINLSNENLEDPPKPLLVKDQTAISRLEKQAEKFLNAVLYRKDVPSFSDPHIPVVAREILQKMIRQFAAEYTSTASSPQDICSDPQLHSDQSLPTEPSGATSSTSPAASLAASAHDQNPVLSKLLMADQDAPLDLTIKKPPAEPIEQEGVLDLSLKRNRYSSSLPVHSSYLSPPTSAIKGESPDMNAAKAKELQSTSTLEQFMAKLCRHHQRQIVDAIGFLQTEVKAFASSSTSQASTCRIQGITPTSGLVGPEKSCTEQRFSSASTHQSRSEDLSRDISTTPKTAFSRKTSSCAGSPLDLHRSESESIQGLVTSIPNFVDTENNRHGDHAPLKMKIMKTNNIADGKKLCVITTSLSSHSGILEDRQGSSNSSNRMEAHTARLSPSVKRHNPAGHAHPVRQRETLRHAKDSPSKSFSVHVTIPSNSPRTARKTIRASSDHRTRDSICRVPADPDLGHCDIVYIDKPITECLREQQRNMLPRRNARKSTRGHMYVEEMWELKTVRTLAGRKERGNCPNPMPEVITLITPKQMLSKPDGVPPVDMPFAAGGREKMSQQTPTEESDERVAPGTGDMGEVASSEIDVIVETSQTDQCQTKGQSAPLSPLSHQTEEKETDINEEKVQDATTDSRTTTESEESVAQVPFEAGKDSTPESRENLPESTDQVAAEPAGEPSENCTVEKDESQLPSAEIHHSESTQDGSNTSVPSDVRNVEEEFKANEKEKNGNEQPQEVLPETQTNHGNLGSTETSNPEVPTAEEMVEQQEINTVNPADSLTSLDTKNCDNDDDDKFDVSSKTLESLLKELPPWRRKRGTVITLPERLKQTKAVIVGYVNGRPISASDRSLRRRSTNSTAPPNKTPVKSKNVPKNTSGDPSAVKQPQEAHTPVKPLPQEADSSPDTPSTSKSKCPSKIKELQKPVQKERDSLPALPDQPLDSSQSTDSKRYLRSAKQKPAATCTSSLTTNPVTSTRPTTARDLPSAEHSPSLPCSSCPPPMSSPRIRQACPPAASEPSQMTAVPEPEKTQATDTKFNKSKKADIESGLQAKKKLRSAKFAADICENEKQQVSSEVSNPLENPVLVENKMESQIKPLRGKRVLRKEVQANDFGLQKKPSVSFIGDRSVSVDDSSSSSSDKVVRMPLRSESSKAETSNHPAVSPPMDNKKLVLRSQRFAALLTSASTTAERQRDVASPTRINPERITKNQVRHSASSTLPHSSVIPAITARPEPLKHNAQKFFEALNHEQNKHLIANLNIKYDKMQKGWIQMDKEGQPATKYKNKADRQAAIWKSKRRTRKPRSSEHQKYSPVQMLFMKSFDLGSICRWFLESTETKSLVIVKKVNTRLPAETQLCFHSSSGISGTSQGVFPSLQAERLKKHLKKFAIASPVKSNPKSQKLIARALEQEANAVKGKERKEISSVAQTLTKASSSFAEAHVQIGESQKAPGKSKNPASARILRKYSNIREKMHVQQTNVRLKKTSTKKLKASSMKTLPTKRPKSNLKTPLKVQKSSLTVKKTMTKSDLKTGKGKPLAGKKTAKLPVVERTVKAQSGIKAKISEMPKRCSQRLGSPKTSEHNLVNTLTSKVDSNKKHSEAELEKSIVNKIGAGKIQMKESSQSTVSEVRGTEDPVEIPQQSGDIKVPVSPDQVLTRSQRKMEALVPLSPSSASKKAAKSTAVQSGSPETARKNEKPILTRSGALKSVAKRSQAASTPSRTPKLAAKRTQELLETPAKRTRMSLSK